MQLLQYATASPIALHYKDRRVLMKDGPGPLGPARCCLYSLRKFENKVDTELINHMDAGQKLDRHNLSLTVHANNQILFTIKFLENDCTIKFIKRRIIAA